jgi:hypothetical protein
VKSERGLLLDVMPASGNLLPRPYALRPNGVARGADVTMSARSQRSASTSPRHGRASFSGWSPTHHSQLLSPGYEQYQKSLLEVPWPADYGEASSDDLSSEWDSDVPDVPPTTPSKVVVISYTSRACRLHYVCLVKNVLLRGLSYHFSFITNLMHLFIKHYHNSHLKLHTLKISVMHN